MRLRRVVPIAVAVVVLGSGAVNISSVIGPSLPGRAEVIDGLFPLQFVHFSRSLTLLIGFALVISSINIYKRKRRAWLVVSFLTLASVVLHMTKGLDYEEAAVSALLGVLLLLSRRIFVVRSSVPDFRWGFVRLAASLAAFFAYGVAGFWLLDQREFGLNFTLGDSIRRTFLFLSFVGDPTLTPHTRYARWFMDSLYLMTAAAIIYSIYAKIRPVAYRYGTVPNERQLAAQITSRHGRSSLDFFKYWPDKTFFFLPRGRTYVAYKDAAGHAVSLADPVGPEEEIEPAVLEFSRFCEENDWRVVFHQTLPDFLPIYRKAGFRKLKIGDDAIADLDAFNLEGKGAKKLRHTMNQLEKQGIRFVHYPAPLAEDVLTEARDVSEAWLQIPGRRERTFTLGLFDPDYVRGTPLWATVDRAGRMLSFVNDIPSFSRGEATIDLMRYRTDAPPGLMEYLFTKLLLAKKAEGFVRFNLGMAPMSGFQEKEEASIEERAVHNFMQHMNFLFSYQGLKSFKAKFATRWEPRYVIYRNILNLPLVARAIAEVTELHE
jgi:phosphatidylglycerol lysyltransferase